MGRVAQPHPAAARPRHASNAIGALRMKHLFAGIHSLGPPELPNTSNQHCNTGLARTGGRHWEESSPPPRLEIPDHPRHCPYVSGPRHRRTPPPCVGTSAPVSEPSEPRKSRRWLAIDPRRRSFGLAAEGDGAGTRRSDAGGAVGRGETTRPNGRWKDSATCALRLRPARR